MSIPFDFHYCVRDPERMAFRERILNGTFRERVHLHFDNGPTEQRLHAEAAIGKWDVERDKSTHIYVCGPLGFINHIMDTASSLGWPAANVHVEHFASAPTTSTEDGSFKVRLANDDRVFDVPADRSIASVLIENGVDIPVSCEQGVCGACVTRVLEGEADHRDVCLSDAEHEIKRQFTPCCSRALSPLLVLEI